MNKKGHVALAVACGSGTLLLFPHTSGQVFTSLLTVAAAAIGGLAPDLDHKTSTASQKIQFSARKRRSFRQLSIVLLTIGASLLLWTWFGEEQDSGWLPALQHSYPLWLGGGLLFMALSRLRSLVLIGAGALLLLAGSLYDWHWLASFAGAAFMLLPLVKHRGVIHTPEFALALSVGVLSFVEPQGGAVLAIGLGFVIGWWAHLAGDCFGREGIHSLILPKIGIAMKLFSNGGSTERWIARVSWIVSAICWIVWAGGLTLPHL